MSLIESLGWNLGESAAITASLFKSVAILGAGSGFIALPGAAATFNYAVGKVFLEHFTSGESKDVLCTSYLLPVGQPV